MIFLETDRLFLRNVQQKDAEIMFDYRNNEICARYQRGQVKDLDGIKALIERRKNDNLGIEGNCLIGVVLKASDNIIGEIVVMPNDGCISLGYTFSYKHHRNGYAFEALSTLIESLHDHYPDWEFICFTEPENVASMNLLTKLGYTDYGYVEKITSNVFGKWVIGDPLK